MTLDSVFFTFNQPEAGKVQLKIAMNGEPWRYLVTDYDAQNSPTFWQGLEAQTKELPFEAEGLGPYQCPGCGSVRKTFLRPFDHHYFCGFCGAHLKMVDGKLCFR